MITGLILAAGQSRRMGQPKMKLPWGATTVLEQVIKTLKTAGVRDLLVVTGGDRKNVEALVAGSAKTVHNPAYDKGEMLSSARVGLAALKPDVEAALITLGDQPQIQESVVRQVLDSYKTHRSTIVVPSYNNRRGHPWLVDRKHWPEIIAIRFPETLRDFLDRHSQDIYYTRVENDSILQDLDTPKDYLESKP